MGVGASDTSRTGRDGTGDLGTPGLLSGRGDWVNYLLHLLKVPLLTPDSNFTTAAHAQVPSFSKGRVTSDDEASDGRVLDERTNVIPVTRCDDQTKKG